MASKLPAWAHGTAFRWLVAVAVCAAAAALTFVIATRTGGGQSQLAEFEEQNAAYRDMAAIGQRESISAAEADELVGTFEETEDLGASRTALVTIADLLGREEVRMEPAVRSRLESVLIQALDHEQWRVRSSALAGCRDAGLVGRDDVRSRIRTMRNDPNEHVATLAQRTIDSVEDAGG